MSAAVPLRFEVPQFPLQDYLVRDWDALLTPALVIYPDVVDRNIDSTLKLVGGDTTRWRPHVKTAKLEFVTRRLVERGVTQMKCATTLELSVACRCGATDVLVAYPVQGANAERVKSLTSEFPKTKVSVLVESAIGLDRWSGTPIGVFIDINPGMNRTGINANRVAEITALSRQVRGCGLEFRGLHYYDGHLGSLDFAERVSQAHHGYDTLLSIIESIIAEGSQVDEVVTSGTPAFMCSLSYAAFRSRRFRHSVSPGTIVYSDLISIAQLPAQTGYQPAAVVLSRVVSHPSHWRITCDAGHKALAIDCGVPNCSVIGHPELQPTAPSEEHLPIDVPAGLEIPRLGEPLYLIPRHVCPTVNNFDEAVIVRSNRIEGLETVSARGREPPLIKTL